MEDRILVVGEHRRWKKEMKDGKIGVFNKSRSGQNRASLEEIFVMPACVTAMHYVTVEFRLRGETLEGRDLKVTGEHRFLYGVESWIDGVDQQLENLEEGELVELILDSEASAHVASHLLHENKVEDQLVLNLRVVQVVKAEPREVIKALAASVKCCDHCGNH